MEYKDLLRDISKCIEKRSKFSKELPTDNNRWVLLRILPYIDEKKRAKGVVLVLTDVTEMRNLEFKLSRQHDHFRKTMNSVSATRDTVSLLIVDDSPDDREIITRELSSVKSVNYNISQRDSVKSGLEAIENSEFDVVLIDYHIVPNTAFDLIEQLTQSLAPEKVPAFVLLSGVLSPEVAEKAMTLGVFDALSKDELSSILLNKCIQHAMQKREMALYYNAHQGSDSVLT